MPTMFLRSRRRVGDAYYHDHAPHAQSWREAANDDAELDALRAARGIIGACVIGGAMWALIAVFVWAVFLIGE